MVNNRTVLILLLVISLAWFFLVRQTTTLSLDETGDTYFAKREYKQAITAWEKVLKQNGDDPEIMEKIGKVFLRLAKFERAEKIFEKIVEIDPGAVDIHLELVRLNILNGKHASAERICMMLKKKVPSNAEVEILLGDLALFNNRPEQAEIFYRKALDLYNGSPKILLKLATCLVVLGKRQEANKIFSIADKPALRTVPVLVQMADYFLVAGKDENAEACLIEAVKKEPKDLDIKVRLALLYRSGHDPDDLEKGAAILASLAEDDPDNLYFKKILADIYISLNKIDAAEAVITAIGKIIQESDPDYEVLQGKYWLYKGNYIYAAAHLKSAVDVVPGFFWAHYLLGVAYLMGGQNQLGENSIENALYLYPDQPRALLLMASIMYKKGKYSLGLDYLNRLKDREPENNQVYRLEGLNRLGLKDYEQARVSFASALAINPQDMAALYLLGVTAESLNMETLAMDCYKKVLDKKNKLADVLHQYITLLMKQGNVKAADDLLAGLFDKNADNPYYNYIASLVDLKAKRIAAAEAHLKKAISGNPVLGEPHVSLGELYLSQGRISEAIETLEVCTTKLPDFEDAWIRLAGIYLKMDKPLEALGVMQRAEKKLPVSPAILGNLAWLYLETGSEDDLALDFARRAYEKNPDDSAITDTLAWVYYKKGAFGQAVWLLAAVEAKEPENGMVLYHLGMSLYGQGKLFEAVEKLKKASATDLGDIELNRIKEILSLVQGETKPKESDTLEPEFDFSEPAKLPFAEPLDSLQSEDLLQPQWQKERKHGDS